MARAHTVARVAAYVAYATLASAATDFFYTTDGVCPWRDPDTIDCNVPGEDRPCLFDTFYQKGYCCSPGDDYCWTYSDDCTGDDGGAGSGQIDCQSSFCCIDGFEICTQTTNQINVCWLASGNPYKNVTVAEANSTYSSLVSASPSAATLTFDAAQALQTSSTSSTSTSSTSTSTTPTASQTTTTTTATAASGTPTTTASADTTGTLSGGAIGGIVVGAVAALLALSAAVYFFVRKRQTSPVEADGNPTGDSSVGFLPPNNNNTDSYYTKNPSSYYAQDAGSYHAKHMEDTQYERVEMASNPVHEMMGEGRLAELSTGEHESHELLGQRT